ncbi:hypothetical protein LshimejAT787_0506350 [Lyophyllum shimeji]|uniref:Uncharacterized protein n=1 Tax=Lyophyllum shimeji TaxID=47721 RepID=A0A9P3UP99_LYOSH|nr:hypothetical protein LshimejAT787_0506350 [Lyophyllum shimeji]
MMFKFEILTLFSWIFSSRFRSPSKENIASLDTFLFHRPWHDLHTRPFTSDNFGTPYLDHSAPPTLLECFRPTLRRELLQSTDFVNASNSPGRCILLGPGHVEAWIAYEPQSSHLPAGTHRHRFPRDARGFLYYHCDHNLPPTAGEIRFRLTPNDNPATFEDGIDLIDDVLDPGGFWIPPAHPAGLRRPPYFPRRPPPASVLIPPDSSFLHRRIPDSRLIVAPRVPHITIQFLQGKGSLDLFSLDLPLPASCESASVQGSPLQHALEQPFLLNIGSETNPLKIFTLRRIGSLRFLFVFSDTRGSSVAQPYSGRILARFERSTLPQHAGTRSVVLRVLKILDPIKSTIPGYDMYLPRPQEGALLLRPRGRVFSANLDDSRSSFRDLNLFSTT